MAHLRKSASVSKSRTLATDGKLFSKPSEIDVGKVERLWGRMTYEVNLMTTRTNWLVTSQSFLFAAYFFGTARLQEGENGVQYLIPLLPAIGLAVCWVILTYVRASIHILGESREELKELQKRYPAHFADRVDHSNKATKHRQSATIASFVLVGLFVLFWIIASAILIHQNLANIGHFLAPLVVIHFR